MLKKEQKLPNPVVRMTKQQVAIAVVLAALFLEFVDAVAAMSVLAGASVFILGNLVFAGVFFRFTGARQSKKIIQSFYIGECLKIAVSILLFVIMFKFLSLNMLAFWVAFVACQAIVWVALIDKGVTTLSQESVS